MGTAIVAALLAVILVVVAPTAASAQGDDDHGTEGTGTEGTGTEEGGEVDPAAEEAAEELRQGQQVYSQVCSSCHQPGGAGLPGQFPPLIDNPNVDDAAYVADVINNGLQGPVTVGGETFDGIMPSFSTLGEDDIDAVIAYLQNDLEAPVDEAAAVAPTGPVAGTELPALTDMGAITAYLLAAAVAALVLAPRLLSANDRLSVPWLDAWLKSAVIVLAVALLVVYVPDWALKWGPVTDLSRFGQDLIGTGLWAGGLVVILGALWYAHRESRV